MSNIVAERLLYVHAIDSSQLEIVPEIYENHE